MKWKQCIHVIDNILNLHLNLITTLNHINILPPRHILEVLHFNENLKREVKKSKEGKVYYKVTYPKFKLGKEVVREVPVPPSYGK